MGEGLRIFLTFNNFHRTVFHILRVILIPTEVWEPLMYCLIDQKRNSYNLFSDTKKMICDFGLAIIDLYAGSS